MLNKEKVLWPYGIMDLRDLFWSALWRDAGGKIESLAVAGAPHRSGARLLLTLSPSRRRHSIRHHV